MARKKFNDLRKKMSPDSRKRASERADGMLREMRCPKCDQVLEHEKEINDPGGRLDPPDYQPEMWICHECDLFYEAKEKPGHTPPRSPEDVVWVPDFDNPQPL
jgi:hypothetical protein